jgi:probable DNA repair protein
MSPLSIAKNELFAQLAQGHAAPATVVTPNRRLAQALTREFDGAQAEKGLAVWEAADILPFGAFVERLYEDALYSELAARLPLLLADAQAVELWEAAIRASRWGAALLAVPQAARDCARAWELAHGWRIAGALESFPGNDDARAFAEWAGDYARRCEAGGHTDAVRLPDVVAPLLGEGALRKPQLLVAYGFDQFTLQQKDFLDACAANGIALASCAPQAREAQAARHAFPSARDELEAAAHWARARLETGARHIGVVVPELGQRRKEVLRLFARVLDPDGHLPGAQAKPPAFNVSLGAPLADFPLVRAALSILELAAGDIPFEQASRLVRSPFLGGGEEEMARRARLDALLRRSAPARIGLGKLVGLAERCPLLRQHLEALYAQPKRESASPHEWGRHFSALLDAAGFPGRSLDSAEYQARAKFNDTLAELAKLERVAPTMSMGRALARLRGLCGETLFQPETPDAPIQVLGALESAGLEFDALWVSGLTDEAWPLAARPNPFIAPALQRKAGIPEASAEASLARARRITDGWLGAAAEVVVSCALLDGERALLPSPLIAGMLARQAEEVPSYARYRDLVYAARRLESAPDGRAPALATRTPRGGTRILADQAACPFRAFAHHRLAAEALEAPAEGPDARARGLLLHALMKALWSELKSSDALQGDCAAAIARAAHAAVAEAGLEEPFAGLERTRLGKLAAEWLELERARAPFEVAALEDKRKLAVASLELNGRIDRLDRLASGGHALIDYKTGRPTPNAWLGERPDDPQLPLYALSASEDIAAVAYARLQPGAMKFMGFGRAKDLVAQAKDWDALINGWKKELEALGAAFAAGEARVDPKDGLATCRYCDLQPLCRVHERIGALGALEEEGE